MLRAELIADLAEAERAVPAWDALAVANGQPACTPAWMLAWWRHVAPAGAELRILAVREAEALVGLVPLYAEPGGRRWRLLASAEDFSASLAPLAAPGRVAEVAEAATALLARRALRPEQIELAPISRASPWTAALRERWPARMRPLLFRPDRQEAPVVSLHGGSYDAWLDGRDYRFRKEARRLRRRFAEAGGTYRWSATASLEADVATFVRLHAARWEGIGGSRLVAMGERLPPFLHELAAGLLAQERFRLLMLELDGEAICADLWLAAGGTVTGVNTGWDERFKRLSPPMLANLHAIEDAVARGERRVELGYGRLDYKRAYANDSDVVTWDRLLLPGATLPRALLRSAPLAADRRARALAKRLLPEAQADRLRALARRRRSG